MDSSKPLGQGNSITETGIDSGRRSEERQPREASRQGNDRPIRTTGPCEVHLRSQRAGADGMGRPRLKAESRPPAETWWSRHGLGCPMVGPEGWDAGRMTSGTLRITTMAPADDWVPPIEGVEVPLLFVSPPQIGLSTPLAAPDDGNRPTSGSDSPINLAACPRALESRFRPSGVGMPISTPPPRQPRPTEEAPEIGRAHV